MKALVGQFRNGWLAFCGPDLVLGLGFLDILLVIEFRLARLQRLCFISNTTLQFCSIFHRYLHHLAGIVLCRLILITICSELSLLIYSLCFYDRLDQAFLPFELFYPIKFVVMVFHLNLFRLTLYRLTSFINCVKIIKNLCEFINQYLISFVNFFRVSFY